MLHGRECECAVVEEVPGRARAGQGAALTIFGDPGTGRTALLEHAVGRAAPPFRTLGARGVAQESGLPYAGLHKLLRPLAGRLDLLSPAQVAALAPAVGDAPAVDAVPSGSAGLFTLCSAVHRLLTGAASDGPLLCWIDDAHRLDPLSLTVLAFTARRLGAESLAMLFTMDPGTSGEQDPLADIPRLRLGTLDEVAARRLLDELAGPGLGDDLAADLIHLSGGNPLALTELVPALTPEQLAGEAPPPMALPGHSRLRARHRRRYRELSRDARRLVLMAVCEEGLETGTLTRAAERAGVDLGALEEARRSGLILLDGENVRVPDPLVRSSLYADAPLAERIAVHDLLAGVLDQGGDRLRCSWHQAAGAGGPDAWLSDELGSAATAARRSGRHADAARAWQRSASLTPEPDVKADRLLAAATDAWLGGRTRSARALLRAARPFARTRELRGLTGLLYGQLELRDGPPAAAAQILLDAADRLAGAHRTRSVLALIYAAEAGSLSGDLGWYRPITRRAAAQARGGSCAPITELMLNQLAGMSATFSGRHGEAAGPLRRVLELSETVDGCAAKVWASIAAFTLGEERCARELATRAVNRARLRGTTALLPWALGALTLAELALGEFTSATATALDGLRTARACGQRNCAAEHLAILTLLAAVQGDREIASLRANAVADLVRERGLARPGAITSWALGFLDLADDDPGEAATRLRSLTTGSPPDAFVAVLATPDFVEAAVRCGQPAGTARAVAAFERWARAAAPQEVPARAALAERCRALLADGDEAEEHFAAAIRLHQRGGSPFELARTQLLYGERLRRGRRRRAAREHLREARQSFQRYGAAQWAGRAEAELRAAGDTTVPAARRETADLTPHQVRIARLVAAGATNREIAARLVLSPRTVDHHLRNIFARLGIRSRVELAHRFR